MSEAWNWIKTHPYWAGGIFVGLLVLIWLWSRRGGAPAGGSDLGSYYNAAAAIQASGNQLQMAQAAYNAQEAIAAAHEATLQEQSAAAVQVAQISSDAMTAQVNAQMNAATEEARIAGDTAVTVGGQQESLGKFQALQQTKQTDIAANLAGEQSTLTAQVEQSAIAGQQYRDYVNALSATLATAYNYWLQGGGAGLAVPAAPPGIPGITVFPSTPGGSGSYSYQAPS